MNKTNAVEMIKSLSNAYGVPGFEEEVLNEIRRIGEPLGTFQEDKIKNLYLERKENQKAMDEPFNPYDQNRPLRIQLDAHTDEVAFMVHAIYPNGTLKFIELGGWVASNIPAHRVKVKTVDGQWITGLTTSKPPHFLSDAERKQALDSSQIVIDIGSTSAEEVEELGIEIGAPVVPDVSCEYNEERDLFIGKAFDCRSGCAAILDSLDQLAGKELAADVYAAFAVQEEVGCRGAQITAQRVKADLAIVFEGCPADDTFGEPELSQTKIAHGPMLRHVDARMITHPGFQRYAMNLAKELEIPMQTAVRSGGATNGSAIHLSNQGVPCIVIGLPVRYIHTHYGITKYHDHKAAVDLAVAILERMNWDVFAAL